MRLALLFLVAACVACARTPAPAPVTATPAPVSALGQLEASLDLAGSRIGHDDVPTVVVLLASWCEHCRRELVAIDAVRARYPGVRWLGLNYRAHEEYDDRGSSSAIRELATATPWLRIVPADEALFAAFGRPPKIPTVFVFDAHGTLVSTFDRRHRPPPDAAELDAVLRTLR